MEPEVVEVVFLGRLADHAGAARRAVRIAGSMRLSRFVDAASEGDPALAEALAHPSVRVAINARLHPAGNDPQVLPGDDVAFMPPFSGG